LPTYIPRPSLESELADCLESGGLTLLVGPRGSGKTTLLQRVGSHLLELEERGPVALVQVEPIAASPEILCQRFLELAQRAVAPASESLSPFARFLASVAAGRRRAALLLDEVTELRTLSYFPGVDHPLESFLVAAASRRAPAILATSRFPTWLASHLAQLPAETREQISLRHVPPLIVEELEARRVPQAQGIVRATRGLPVHVRPLLERMENGESLSESLAVELTVGGRIEAECRATYTPLLHQARGYGACKSALHVLADEEGLSLSEIARRMGRTAGSVRDYLWWLQEVELVTAREKRFFFVDPVLRLWLRVYGRGLPPSSRTLREEVERHLAEKAAADLPVEPAAQPPFLTDDDLIEID